MKSSKISYIKLKYITPKPSYIDKSYIKHYARYLIKNRNKIVYESETKSETFCMNKLFLKSINGRARVSLKMQIHVNSSPRRTICYLTGDYYNIFFLI